MLGLAKKSCLALLVVAVAVGGGGGVGAEPRVIERAGYGGRLAGFWLGQSIGNWTGLVTEMDKVGGEGVHGRFYRAEDWGGPDQPAIWGEGQPSDISPTIGFVLRRPGEVWGADDDTDIEYMYQWVLHQSGGTRLAPAQIRDAWLTHIYDESQPTPFGADGAGFQNFLWVSNQRAHELMLQGVLPPATSDPLRNPHGEMIDAQLTTEIFGLFAPGSPEAALELAHYAVRTAGAGDAVLAAEFYIVLHALAAETPVGEPSQEMIMQLAERARRWLPDGSTPAAMYDLVLSQYESGVSWETARDRLHQRYQVEMQDGYDIPSRGLYCNGCFASGINFAASLVSLFYGEGDIRETIKIAALCGWDSDNPAATWGGLLGFIMGQQAVETAFGGQLSSAFNIHRTRRAFPNEGLDDFANMAQMGLAIADRMVTGPLAGRISPDGKLWLIP